MKASFNGVFACAAVVVAIVIVAFVSFRPNPAEADARHFAEEYAKSKDAMNRCSMADLTGDAYGKASNREKYDEWMAIRAKDCAQAGVTIPQLPYQPVNDRH
jgi:hypothetical protein